MRVITTPLALWILLSFSEVSTAAPSEAQVCAAASLEMDKLRAKSPRELERLICAAGFLATVAEKHHDKMTEELCLTLLRGVIREYKGRFPGRDFAAAPKTCEDF